MAHDKYLGGIEDNQDLYPFDDDYGSYYANNRIDYKQCPPKTPNTNVPITIIQLKDILNMTTTDLRAFISATAEEKKNEIIASLPENYMEAMTKADIDEICE